MKKLLLLFWLLPFTVSAQIWQSGTMQFSVMNPGVNSKDSVRYNYTPGKIGGYSYLYNAEYIRTHFAAIGSSGVPTSRQIIAGYGLLGGGDLSANRTLKVDTTYLQTIANFFPKGDTRWIQSGVPVNDYIINQSASQQGATFWTTTGQVQDNFYIGTIGDNTSGWANFQTSYLNYYLEDAASQLEAKALGFTNSVSGAHLFFDASGELQISNDDPINGTKVTSGYFKVAQTPVDTLDVMRLKDVSNGYVHKTGNIRDTINGVKIFTDTARIARLKVDTSFVDTTGNYYKTYQNAISNRYKTLSHNNAAKLSAKIFAGTSISIEFRGHSIFYGLRTGGALPPINGNSNNRTAFNIPDRVDTALTNASLAHTIINHGYPGDYAQNGWYRWRSASAVDVLFLEYGLNEALNTTDLEVFRRYMVVHIQQALNRGTVPLITIPVFPKSASNSNRVKQVAQILQELATEFECPLISQPEQIRWLSNSAYVADNVHLTDAGYTEDADGIASFLLNGNTFVATSGQFYTPGTMLYRLGSPANTSEGLTGETINLAATTGKTTASFYLNTTVDVYESVFRTSVTTTNMIWTVGSQTTLDTIGAVSNKKKFLFRLYPGYHTITVKNTGPVAVHLDYLEFRALPPSAGLTQWTTIPGGVSINSTTVGIGNNGSGLTDQFTIGPATARTFNTTPAGAISNNNATLPYWVMKQTTAGGELIGAMSSTTGIVGTYGNFPIEFRTNGTARLTIANTGPITFNTGYSTGLLHSSSVGLLTSSLVSLTADVTGVLPAANGGLSFGTFTAGDMPYASATNTWSRRTIGTAGYVLTSVGGFPVWNNIYAGTTAWTAIQTFNAGLISLQPISLSTNFTSSIADLRWSDIGSGFNMSLLPQTGALTGNVTIRMPAISGTLLTSNDIPRGQVTLTAGTNAVSVTGVTTSSRAVVTLVSIGGTVTTTWQYKAVCTAGTVTISAITNTGTTDTTDTSTLNYIVII